MPRLTPTPLPTWEDRGAPVSLQHVVAEATERARWTVAPGLRVRRAYTWSHSDRHDPTWWPQGISCSDDLILVSWYSKAGAGVRITVLDRATRRYAHVPLLLPTTDGTLGPLLIHAGGLAWAGTWLHVAATGRGLFSAHLDDLRRLPDGELVWPVRLHHQVAPDDSAKLRYSFVSVTDRGELLAGEYGGPESSRRLARYELDANGTLRLGADGVATATAIDVGVASMQGATRVGDDHLLMVSRGRRRPGDLWTGRGGRLRRHSFAAPPGPEDVSWDGRLLWSVTEFPGRRWLFALRAPRR